jgi:hypothetical protein
MDRTTKEHTMARKCQRILDAILHQHAGLHDPVALIRAGRVLADGKQSRALPHESPLMRSSP